MNDTVITRTNAYYIYDQSDNRVARKGALKDEGRAEDDIITDSVPNEPNLGGGT